MAALAWPARLARGSRLLLLLAQALKAFGWARLFTNRERPSPLALVAGNGGAALIGVVLPGRFDDAMRIAVVAGAGIAAAAVIVALPSVSSAPWESSPEQPS